MSTHYDENMLNKFIKEDVDILCRDLEEFNQLMDFFENERDEPIITWNGGNKLPTELTDAVSTSYDCALHEATTDIVIRVVSRYHGHLLYGIYEVDDQTIVDRENVYAFDIINYKPISIDVNNLANFLGGN